MQVPPAKLELSINQVLANDPAQDESLTAHKAKMAFVLSWLVVNCVAEYPSYTNAASFDAYLGSREISVAAVSVHSFFALDNIVKIADHLFGTSASGCTVGKSAILVASVCLGAWSRMRGAGVAFVAPGIDASLRIAMALLKIIGTCPPEIFSMKETLELFFNRLGRFLRDNPNEKTVLAMRDNLALCIETAKEALLSLPEEERRAAIEQIDATFADPHTKNGLQKILDLFVTKETIERAAEKKRAYASRKFLRVLTALITGFGTSCSIGLNLALSKIALNNLLPGGEAKWKFVPAGLAAGAIAYTGYTKSFKGADNSIDLFSATCGNALQRSVSKTLYPKLHVAAAIISLIWVAALFGSHYESVNKSVGLATTLGKLLLTGIVIGSLFLYSQSLQHHFDNGVRFAAAKQDADSIQYKTVKVVSKLEKLEGLVKASSAGEFVESLAYVGRSEVQEEILHEGIEAKFSHLQLDDQL